MALLPFQHKQSSAHHFYFYYCFSSLILAPLTIFITFALQLPVLLFLFILFLFTLFPSQLILLQPLFLPSPSILFLLWLSSPLLLFQLILSQPSPWLIFLIFLELIALILPILPSCVLLLQPQCVLFRLFQLPLSLLPPFQPSPRQPIALFQLTLWPLESVFILRVIIRLSAVFVVLLRLRQPQVGVSHLPPFGVVLLQFAIPRLIVEIQQHFFRTPLAQVQHLIDPKA